MAETHILLVEDSASDVEIVRSLLDDSEEKHFRVTHALDIAIALLRLSECTFDVVLLDLSLPPDSRSLNGLFAIQNRVPTLPIIILTGHDDEALALKAVESGAQDYLLKDKSQSNTLKIAISYAIQRKRFEDNITRRANYDSLTGLANRMLFEHRLEMALARIQRSGQGIGVLFLDLDDFKHVNDTLGHAAGDLLLKEIAGRMVQCVRPYDTIARIGGDEFAILIEDIKDPYNCAAIAQKFIDVISKPMAMDMLRITVGVSIGIATYNPTDKAGPVSLIDQADTAMYRAKEEERSNYRFYTHDMEESLRLRKQLEDELCDAVRKGELTLCYQPKQTLDSGEISGVEALVRWDHPRLGTLLPDAFLDFAKGIHRLEEIESWVLSQVFRDMERWRNMNLPPLQVAVNISAGRFDSPEFFLQLASLIEIHGIRPELLAVELPEEVFAPTDPNRARRFAKLYKLGVAITMDKFGGHMSSLQSLKGIALSELKFDSRFTQSAGGQMEDVRLIKAIVACAHAFGIRVVALGVESDELRAGLKQQQCDAIQGFIFSRPMPAAFLEHWLLNRNTADLSEPKRIAH